MSNKRQRTSNNQSDDVFEYTGNGQTVPKDVVSVRFHPSVVEVDEYAFKDCQLKEVVMNEGLEKIGDGAFQGCPFLESIHLPSTVTKIGTSAIVCCSNLTEVILNDGLTSIEGWGFSDCKSLQSITIPSTVNEIGRWAFHKCNRLREVVLSDGLKKIGNRAFQLCISLQSITIPSTVDEIDNYAFYYCANIRGIVVNAGIKKINQGAFQHTSIERIAIPSTVIEIDKLAFRDCSRLREVIVHNGEIWIEDRAFENCTSLQRFKFPSLSTRLENIIQAGQKDIEAKMDDIPAVEWRGGELSIPAVRRESEDYEGRMEISVKVDKEKLDKIKGLIRYYEIKEATTLFELALWKARIDQAGDSNGNCNAHRIEVPGPVKDAILQYLS